MNIVKNPLGDSESICTECKYLLRRLIIPFNDEQFGIDRADMDIPDDEEIILEHYMCTEAFLDLDHIVVECNKFKSKTENKLFRNNF